MWIPPKARQKTLFEAWLVRASRWKGVLNSWLGRAVGRVPKTGWKRLVLGLVAVVTGLATFTEAVDGVIDRSVDGCRMVNICDPPPPSVWTGAFTELRVGAAGIPLQEVYAEGNRTIPATMPQETREWPGRLITYRVEFQGLECVCSVRWTLHDATTGRRIPSPTNRWETRHVKAFPNGAWVVDSRQTEVVIGLIWVPNVEAGTFIIEVELLDEQGVYFDIERTEPFEV